MAKLIHHHASVVIIESEEGREFLFAMYDNTYPKVLYRGRANLIGGNASAEDNSPYDILLRELEEEFAIKKEKKFEIEEDLTDILGNKSKLKRIKKFANNNDIKNIKESILKSCVAFQDFLVEIPSLGGSPGFNAICSVFISRLPRAIFECARENTRKAKEITCEGSIKIASLDDLKSGKVLTAWGTSSIMEYYTKTKIPNPEGINAIPLGAPRRLFSDYLKEFQYANSIKGKI